MLRFFQNQNNSAKPRPSPNDPALDCDSIIKTTEAKAKHDRRKVSGSRVSCQCEFTVRNEDPFNHFIPQVKARIDFNVRGCLMYVESGLTAGETKSTFPESRLIMLKEMRFTVTNQQILVINNLAVRRIRLLSDENGFGVVLRFVNLTEMQLDALVSIGDALSED